MTNKEIVKAMHEIIISLNDEMAYATWIYTVPDCPSEEDFEDIANDPKEFKYVASLFLRLMKRYAADGFFNLGEDKGDIPFNQREVEEVINGED